MAGYVVLRNRCGYFWIEGFLMKPSPVARYVDWPSEINQTLVATGWSILDLGEALGLYIQKDESGKRRSCNYLYSVKRGKSTPPYYFLLALRYLQGQYDRKNNGGVPYPVPTTKPVEDAANG